MIFAKQQQTCPFRRPYQLFEDFTDLRGRKELEYSEVLHAYVVSRYEDIIHVLDRPELFSSRVTVPDPPEFLLRKFKDKVPTRGTLLGWDNPDHDRLRLSVSSFFVPRRLARFEPMIRRLAHGLIDQFALQGNVDLKQHFALPLPLKVMCVVVGIDPARWDWVGRSLALFGGHADFAAGTFEEKLEGIMEIHEHVANLIQLRKSDRQDDLISHIWNERDAGHVQMTDFEHLSMIPGLLLAGHETTTNLLSMGLSHLLGRDLWMEASSDESSISRTLEELLRFESAITGMRREVTAPTAIGSTVLHTGDIVFVAYNSGSRDPSYFDQPDRIMIDRKSTTQHLGFGRGIHACLGAPLARLLLSTEMSVLRERLPSLQLAPNFELQYGEVHEGRGVDKLLVQWDAENVMRHSDRAIVPEPKVPSSRGTITMVDMVVDAISKVAENVLEVSLMPKTGSTLPEWSAGANIHVPVGVHGTRQYSLCSDPQDNAMWKIAVLREAEGTGGSKYIHHQIKPGMAMQVRLPRNRFELKPAKRYSFIAGGIGVTPIKSMIHAARASGTPYKLLYLGSSLTSMAYVEELRRDCNVRLWPKDELGRFDLSTLVRDVLADELIYACGPSRLLSALQDLCAHLPAETLNIEHFDNTVDRPAVPNQDFDIVLKRSSRTLRVHKDRSILDVLQANGTSVLSTCTKGTCGTCEVDVLEGDIDHRDTVLTQAEKEDGKSMMVCVSRCLSSRLVLDLW